MKNQQLLRLLLQDRVQRALMVNETSMLSECKKIGLSPKTVYDFDFGVGAWFYFKLPAG